MPPKRKSWLPFSKKTDPAVIESESKEAAPPPSAFKDPDPTDRLRPIQFSPNRLQTLYVTPSERNLYLAAMSQWDENPPHLALWSDPAPSLPHIDSTDAISSPINEGGGWPERQQSPIPIDPRLVTSPEARSNGGLQIRDEFRRHAPAKEVRYANMALTGAGGLRFTRFPAKVLLDLEKLFPANKVVTESNEGLLSMGNGVVPFWKVKMFGSMWKRTGAEELDPIRLLISLIECLGTHGWTVVSSIRAGGSKTDVQNLLFTYTPETAADPPAYFALSFPVPDRISLISAPPKATPALLSAIRNAITTTSLGHQRSATGDAQESGKKRGSLNDKKAKIRVEGWVYDGVYRFWLDGLRRKLVGGVKKDAVELLQPHVVLNIISALSSLHYTLTASVPLLPISAGRDILIFASQPDTGVAARDAYVPKARTPSTGTDGTESPVLIQRTSSFPIPVDKDDPRDVDPEKRKLPWTSTVHTAGNGHNRSTSVDQSSTPSRAPSTQPQPHQHRRNISLDSTPVVKPQSSSVQSSPRPRNLLLKKTSLRRQGSNSSTINPKNQSLPPRSRRTSDAANTRRDEPGRRVPVGTLDGTGLGDNNAESWLVVDPPQKVGHRGLSMHTDPATGREITPPRETAPLQVQHRIPAPQITSLAPEIRPDDNHESERGFGTGGPSYEPPSANISPPRLPPRPPQLQEQLLAQQQEQLMVREQVQQAQLRDYHFQEAQQQDEQRQLSVNDAQRPLNTANIPLGRPITTDETSAVSSIPTYLPLKTPRSPNRVNQAERVDIGIPGVHGSLGYIPSMMSFDPSHVSHNPVPTDSHTQYDDGRGRDFDPAVVSGEERYDDALSHMPGGLGLATESRKGKGKEGARRVWEEDRGVWVEMVTPHSIGPDGPGSARTKISLS